ncbi:MAG: pyridoxal phosphate-dependent aminotransferase [Pseudomonadota bacterium]|nr:pyridoxal phosphate-dependent aminotransferase [Pseudomonadota bacterium]
MRTASRLDHIEPFYVMEFAKAAAALARSPACDPAQGGEPMIFLNIGEPDFTAVAAVQSAAQHCLAHGQTQYTDALGQWPLRQAIANWYDTRFGLRVAPERIVVTAGASAALQLITSALFESGDEVLMPDPSYPCNRHFVAATGATARLLRTTAASRFQPDAAAVAAHWTEHTRGVLLASPGNPTGTSIAPAEMAKILQVVRAHGGVAIIDEIYLGLSYDDAYGQSALVFGDDVISINSFSKYFGMTGWRLGWMVLPSALVAPVEKLAQNLYICASTLAQHAALACFETASLAEYETRRTAFRQRRDFVVPALRELGLDVPVTPDGAFYAWFDCSRYSDSSWDFCQQMMQRAHVALTPGRDFGPADAQRFVRLSFATALPLLQTALQRLARELQPVAAAHRR